MGIWSDFTNLLAGHDAEAAEAELQAKQHALEEARLAKEAGLSNPEILQVQTMAQSQALKDNPATAPQGTFGDNPDSPNWGESLLGFLADVGAAWTPDLAETVPDSSGGKLVGEALLDLKETAEEQVKTTIGAAGDVLDKAQNITEGLIGKLTIPLVAAAAIALVVLKIK